MGSGRHPDPFVDMIGDMLLGGEPGEAVAPVAPGSSVALNPSPSTQAKSNLLNACVTTLTSLIKPASGSIPNEYILPGADFSPGGIGALTDAQFLWDSAFAAVAAASRGMGARAQLWLKNWPATQQGGGASTLGMFPNYIRPGGAHGVNSSQPPIIAWATYQVYLKTLDTAFLTAMYASLKSNYTWWETNRDDTTSAYAGSNLSNLAAWGCTGTMGSLDLAEKQGRLESGLDTLGIWHDPDRLYDDVETDPGKATYISIDLNCYLIMEADSISKIATVLGNSADATTYATKRDNRRATLDSVCWDEEQKCYQRVSRQALSQGGFPNTSGVTAAGSLTVNIASPLTVPLPPGAKIIFATGATAQIGLAGQKIGDTTLNLLNGTTGSIASNVVWIVRWFSYSKSLADLVLPLWAGVPSTLRAQRIVYEHLLKEYSGDDPETYSIFFGSAYRKNRILKFRHVEFRGPQTDYAPQTGVTLQADGVTLNGAGVLTQLRLGNPTTAGSSLRAPHVIGWVADAFRPTTYTLPYDYAFYRRAWEFTSPGKILNIAVKYVVPTGNAASWPEVKLQTAPAYAIAADSPTFPFTVDTTFAGGTPGAIKTDSITESGGNYPWAIQVFQPAGNNSALKLLQLDVTTWPVGFVYLSPYGLLISPRMADLSYARPETDDPHQNPASAIGVAGPEGGQADYCNGSHWLMLEYFACMGLLNYSMYTAAADVATRVITRVYNEWVRTGQLWEYYGMRGTGRGSQSYEWTCLVGNLIDQFGFPLQ